MIWTKLVFGGFGRRGLEAVVALAVVAPGAVEELASDTLNRQRVNVTEHD